MGKETEEIVQMVQYVFISNILLPGRIGSQEARARADIMRVKLLFAGVKFCSEHILYAVCFKFTFCSSVLLFLVNSLGPLDLNGDKPGGLICRSDKMYALSG